MAKIMVVDDDAELRELICEALTGAGFEVHALSWGEEALDKLSPDVQLVLLDLMMPGMGGMTTVSLLKQKQPGVRIVMLTAFATVENAVEAMRRGADDYLSKPFKLADLLMVVRKNLEEAKFVACSRMLDMDQTFNCLSNAMRRDILRVLLQHARVRFMDIARMLGVDDHTKMNFHLKNLRDAGLVGQDAQKCYVLTAEGRKVLDCLDILAKNLSGGS